MDEQTKYKVYSLLERKVQPHQIADDLSVSYAGVLRMRKEYDEAKLNGDIANLLDVDRLVVHDAAEQLGLDATTVTKGLDGLELLSSEFQVTATQINTRVRTLIMSVEHIGELESAADILCKLQNAFLNKNIVQVNTQNNFGADNNGAKRYSQYLNDAPGS